MMYSLKDGQSIIFKGADNVAAVIFWDLECYLKEVRKQLEVLDDPSALVSTIFKSLERIRKYGDLSQDTRNYFFVNNPKVVRFFLVP